MLFRSVQLRDWLARFAHSCCRLLLLLHWPQKDVTQAFDRSTAAPPVEPDVYRKMEDFLAAQIVVYMASLGAPLQGHAAGLIAESLMMLLAATSYVLFPQAMLGFLLAVWVVFLAGAVVQNVFDLERDEVLSRIHNTRIQAITWDGSLLRELAVYIGPVVLVLLSQFTSIWSTMWSWIEPTLRVFE